MKDLTSTDISGTLTRPSQGTLRDVLASYMAGHACLQSALMGSASLDIDGSRCW